jgi:hypothetical protein
MLLCGSAAALTDSWTVSTGWAFDLGHGGRQRPSVESR